MPHKCYLCRIAGHTRVKCPWILGLKDGQDFIRFSDRDGLHRRLRLWAGKAKKIKSKDAADLLARVALRQFDLWITELAHLDDEEQEEDGRDLFARNSRIVIRPRRVERDGTSITVPEPLDEDPV